MRVPLVARAAIVGLVGIIAAFQIVRSAVVEWPPTRASVGASVWSDHPAVITDRTMAEIGALARRGQRLPPELLATVALIARKSPLATEPFLIHGALAQSEGREKRAEGLFIEARSRDPRSEAARYFLADRYLRTGRMPEALVEMAVFTKLVPEATVQFAPALARFARTPGALPTLRQFFKGAPEFEPLVLNELALDGGNADLILALASDHRRPGQELPVWQERLVNALVEQGRFEKAQSAWARLSGVRSSGGLFNPNFEELPAPPPFNWTFATSGGVAEPSTGGRLQVIYYGRGDAILAQQMLLLGPGRYQLSMNVSGKLGDGSGIAWSVDCLPQNKAILTLPVGPATGNLAATFQVPQGCKAQRLKLSGSAGEFPQSVDFAVSKLRLAKASAS